MDDTSGMEMALSRIYERKMIDLQIFIFIAGHNSHCQLRKIAKETRCMSRSGQEKRKTTSIDCLMAAGIVYLCDASKKYSFHFDDRIL